MLRLALVLTALAGCTQVFGLESPSRRDASVGPPIDGEVITGDADGAVAIPDATAIAPSLIDIIAGTNQLSGLLVALDAGDLASYDGTSQTWTNLAANVGTSFHRGTGIQASNDDPTFNGTPGARTPNEYFSFDGNDLFREVTAGWGDDGFHGAAAKVTVLAIWYGPASMTFPVLATCYCVNAGDTPGVIVFRQSTTRRLALYQEGNNNDGAQVTTTAAFMANEWSFLATSFDANGGTTDVRHRINSTVEEYPNEPLNYSNDIADLPATIGAFANGQSTAEAGTRLAMLAVWSRALSAADLAALHAAIKADRFPMLP